MMDRRESLKTMLLASLGGTMLIKSCAPGTETDVKAIEEKPQSDGYGRTTKEENYDQLLTSEVFFTEHELATIAVLCDLILPATPTAASAGEAGVSDFIEFIVKDIPNHQLPLRGGIMWLDNFSNKQHTLRFIDCDEDQKIAIMDQIAYPGKTKPGLEQGEKFFSLVRNLTLTGYYTSKAGIEELGYKGNQPNVWDGVPQEVLDKHGLNYEEEWLKKCVDQSKRMDIAKWDDDGNLIS